MIKTMPMIIAMYIGSDIANIASAIARSPINNTNIEVKVDKRLILDISPVIPNTIMINPTR